MRTQRYESGRSMIEIVGVLAIMGLITAAAFVLITSGMETRRRNQAADEVGNIVATYRGLFAEAGNFNNVGSVSLSALKLPTNNPWNHAYGVDGSGTSLTVYVGFDDADTCSIMAARTWSDSTLDNLCIKSEGTCGNFTGATSCISLTYGF